MSRRRYEYLLSVGSNVEPARSVDHALALLRERFEVRAISPPYDVPAAGPPGQPPFVNLAVRLRSDLPPPALRAACRSIEGRCGRVRTSDRYAPRTLDLDVVYSSAPGAAEHGLPDPELVEAGYVLVPCADVWPDARDPASGRTLEALAAARFPTWAAAHARPEGS